MRSLIEYRDLYEFSIIGNYDSFLKYVHDATPAASEQDVLNVIFQWNCSKISEYIAVVNGLGGVEIKCDRRIFVVAPNPKVNYKVSPWRVTYYFYNHGAICEDEFTSAEEAIISVIIGYPEAHVSNGELDTWELF